LLSAHSAYYSKAVQKKWKMQMNSAAMLCQNGEMPLFLLSTKCAFGLVGRLKTCCYFTNQSIAGSIE
jgi:hypothetical protein